MSRTHKDHKENLKLKWKLQMRFLYFYPQYFIETLHANEKHSFLYAWQVWLKIKLKNAYDIFT